MSEITTNTNELINDISVLINNAKVRVAIKANAKMMVWTPMIRKNLSTVSSDIKISKNQNLR